jgi:hypothetical protein
MIKAGMVVGKSKTCRASNWQSHNGKIDPCRGSAGAASSASIIPKIKRWLC